MSKVTGKAWDGKVLRRVFSYSSPYTKLVIFALFSTVVLAVLGPVRVILTASLVSDYIQIGDEQGLLLWTGIICLILFAETIIQYFETFYLNVLGQNVIKDLRVQLVSHIVKLRLKYFDKNPIGMLVTRAVSDMETITQIFTQGIFSIFGDIFKLTVALIGMLYLNWQLSILVLIPIPFLIIATNIFKKAIKKSFLEVRNQVSELNTFVQERVTGMSLVKIFGRQKREASRFQAINEKHKKAHIKSIWAYSIFFPVVEILSAASQGMVVLYVVYQAQQPDVVFSDIAGNMTGFILFIGMFYRPIRQLAERFNTLQMGMVGAERVFKVLDTDATIVNDGTINKMDFKGSLKIKDLHFAYNEPIYVLNGISFEVEEGQMLAFVGATGAGKSTIINILSRFYEFQKGTIEIDGTNIRDIELSYLRQNIAVVLQDVFLYSDTVYNNITLGDHTITLDQVIEASKLVGAHDFISKLPGGYDFDVKERGGLLSVGQRQLISFIRAYVYNPTILILDEATSSIDSESELMIQTAIEKLTKGRTSIVIAHRLSTIRNADQIIVMDKGCIVEQGSHSELIQLKEGKYKELYEHQFED
jgi:ATP-binding cassette subfamily B multidrug efflux pump